MNTEQAVNELKNYHREDGTVPEEITLAIQALETGEIYITGEDYNLYMEGYKALEERPQGEWTIGYTAKQKKVAVCNLCNCISIQGKTNFCHNCGAKIEKGGVEK